MILKILHTWCHLEKIGNDNAYLSYLGLLYSFYIYTGFYIFMNIMEENNLCQAESSNNLDGLLDERKEVILRELHAIKMLLLTNIQYDHYFR